YDVIIVGAGITGCSTALELVRAGLKCLIIEAHDLAFGTSGGTTAHLNTILDHTYKEISSNFGEQSSALVAKGLTSAVELVGHNVNSLSIDCGHSPRNGFIFSRNTKESEELEEIYIATRKAGVNVEWSDRLPIKQPFHKAMLIPGQAQMHPVQYLKGLLNEFTSLGGAFLPNCRVQDVDSKDPLWISTSRGEWRSQRLIYATHIPPGINLLHFRCAPYRSYVMTAQLQDNAYPDGLVYDMEDPYHYYRTQEINGEKWLIAGGEDHKTGHQENTVERLQALTAHVRNNFNVTQIGHQWSSQYFETTDGLPYIGTLPGHDKRVMVATGFSGNGMTLGSLSAIAFRDYIVTGKSEYIDLFDPKRISPVAGFSDFVKENADVVGHMLSKPFLAERIKGIDEIAPGEGRLVKYEGDQLGIYRDLEGSLHSVHTICTHAKCTVKWNNAEKSWDCPCHGSRFSVDGYTLTGPATRDLSKMDPGI
ncbi:MAG: FAD-dependent oxidoreductase, partial [Bacteroidota bacterium]|nr:FAD-dependent oxidoreductase [Bacteroidota bacterium]